MKLTNPSMAYLSDALTTADLTHSRLDKVCAKIDIPVEETIGRGMALENRLWALIENLNDSDKLNLLIKIIVTEYGGNVNEINGALSMSGYLVTEDGNIIPHMPENTNIQEKLSEIEEGLNNVGFEQVAKYFKDGVDAYGKGKNFQNIRNALEGLIKEILDKEIGKSGDNAKNNMALLLKIGILKSCSKNFSETSMELEYAHAYGIYSLLSHFIDHYNTDTEEADRHFIFFQSVGLIWLIVKRYTQYLGV